MPGGDLVYRIVWWSKFDKEAKVPFSCSIDCYKTWEACEERRFKGVWGSFYSGIGLFPKNSSSPEKAIWFENAFYS